MSSAAPSPAAFNVGLIGLGTVGAQVARRLLDWGQTLDRRAGIPIRLCRVLVRDASKQRSLQLPAGLLTTEPAELLDDPRIHAVVEVAGGDEPVRGYLERAIRSGKHVVTANKQVMARHGPELLELAGRHNVDVYFEAAVGGGIPLISTFKVDLQANEIQRIAAIINGTSNYVLGRMSHDGLTLDEAVLEAQLAGYAEADPSEDLDGHDAVAKLAIMASLGLGARVLPESIYREGIRGIEPVDFRYARDLGYEIKLLAQAVRHGHRVELRVHPAMVAHSHPLAGVEGAHNAVFIVGDLVGEVLLYGEGAGGRPTASAVVGDLIDLAGTVRRGVQNRAAVSFDPAMAVVPMDEVSTRAYLRCRVKDSPGVLGAIFAVFGEELVSISSAIQQEAFEDEGVAEFVVTTHPAQDAALRRTRDRIARLDVVASVSTFLRIF